MIHEIDIYGVFIPPMLAWAAVALVLVAVLRQIALRCGLYRFIWHRPLFDLSVLVLVLGGIAALARTGAWP